MRSLSIPTQSPLRSRKQKQSEAADRRISSRLCAIRRHGYILPMLACWAFYPSTATLCGVHR